MLKYWTPDDYALLAGANTMTDLADVALRVLRQMPQPTHMVLGPITTGGFECMHQNSARFRVAIEELDRRGHAVFSQMEFQDKMIDIVPPEPPDGVYHWEILDDFFAPVFRSGHIHETWYLPGWESSRGTRWEREKTAELGIIQRDYPVEWLKQFQPIDCSCETCSARA
ncbi:MAG: hypothetical protein WDZ79_02595 [Candidatus Paceibacterota bacterium]